MQQILITLSKMFSHLLEADESNAVYRMSKIHFYLSTACQAVNTYFKTSKISRFHKFIIHRQRYRCANYRRNIRSCLLQYFVGFYLSFLESLMSIHIYIHIYKSYTATNNKVYAQVQSNERQTKDSSILSTRLATRAWFSTEITQNTNIMAANSKTVSKCSVLDFLNLLSDFIKI